MSCPYATTRLLQSRVHRARRAAASRLVLAADAEVVVTPDTQGPVISPHIYGHFIEHLGGVIYDGIWVGRDFQDSQRRRHPEAVRRRHEAHRRAQLRWPGGCFADGYHWRDGIGPEAGRRHLQLLGKPDARRHARDRDQSVRHSRVHSTLPSRSAPSPTSRPTSARARRRNSTTGCRTATLRRDTVSLADERAANGDREPFGVKWWGVGNESWGCGGDMTPANTPCSYRQLRHPVSGVCRRRTWSPSGLAAIRATWIWAGPPASSRRCRAATAAWSTAFRCTSTPTSATTRRRSPTSRRRTGTTCSAKGCAPKTSSRRTGPPWPSTIPTTAPSWSSTSGASGISPGEEIAPGYILSQPLTLRDALHTAVTFDVFNRHADKIEMANVAQTVNCIHSLFLAQGDQYTRTPPYYVFEMYRPTWARNGCAMEIRVDPLTVPTRDGVAKMPALSGSASIREKRMTVTLTNPSVDAPIATRIRVAGGARPVEGRADRPHARRHAGEEHVRQTRRCPPLTIGDQDRWR